MAQCISKEHTQKLGTVHIKMYILHDYGVTFCLEIPTHRRLQARAYLGIAQVISNCVFLSRGPDVKTHGMPPDPAYACLRTHRCMYIIYSVQ